MARKRGRGNLSGEKVREVLRRLDRGESQREIARALRIGICTVNKISTRKHVLQQSEDSLFQRCTCGALVIMPCLSCSLKQGNVTAGDKLAE